MCESGSLGHEVHWLVYCYHNTYWNPLFVQQGKVK